jgi:hypothetical protein
MNPWMSHDEVRCYIDIIINRDNVKPCDVLEWGVGGSTARFSRVLEAVGCPRSWLAIDHDAVWIARARAASPEWVEFLCVPTGGDRRRPELWADYVAPPALAGRRFDLILVDGRMRRRCLEHAATLLRDQQSLVVLHDAARRYYHSAFRRFARGRFLAKQVWVGQLRDDTEPAGDGHRPAPAEEQERPMPARSR